MLFYYIRNENQKYDTYKKSNNISLKSDKYDEFHSFILTRDDKEIILAKYHYIYVYQIKPFKIITVKKRWVKLKKDYF